MTLEKYPSEWRYQIARARRLALMALIRPLVTWTPPSDLQDGFTIILAASRHLLPILRANLALLARQDLREAREVLVCLDACSHEVAPALASDLASRLPAVPLRLVLYSRFQAAVARRIDWGWVYAWLSWCQGVSVTRTRWALLHDLDALLLRPDLLARRYHAACQGQGQYIGVRPYVGGGVVPDDNLVTTFELMLDAARLRERFRPIQVFNQPHRLQGRRVDLDTFLLVQHLDGQRAVLPIDEEDMVHPSQMICQYIDHLAGRRVNPSTHNLFMLPYYFELGGDPAPLRAVLDQLRAGRHVVDVLGRPVDAAALEPAHVAWYTKQAGRVEHVLHGQWRPEPREYFERLAATVHVP